MALLKEPLKVRTIRTHRLDQNLKRARLKEPVKVRTVRAQMQDLMRNLLDKPAKVRPSTEAEEGPSEGTSQGTYSWGSQAGSEESLCEGAGHNFFKCQECK